MVEPRVSRDRRPRRLRSRLLNQCKAREPAMYQRFGNAFITTDPPEAQVVTKGEFDVATTATLTALLNRAVAEGCRDFRVDLSGVTFCDASTIGLLIGLDRRLRAEGGSLTILGTSACVRRLLSSVGLDSLLGELV